MEDASGLAQCYREMFDIPEGEPIIVLKSPGFLNCPVAGERGVTNCPLGFEHRGVPAEPQGWMRGLDEGESWRECWNQILIVCQQCQGWPQLSSEQAEAWFKTIDLLLEV